MATVAAPTYTATRKWQRWSGTLVDLDRVFKEAVDGLTQWVGTAPNCYLSVVLPALTMDFHKIDDLQTVANDVRKIKTIHLWLNLGARPSVSTTIDDDAPAVSLEVKGNDRLRIEGLRTTLGDLLDTGHRRPRWYGDRSLMVLFGILLGWVIWAALVAGLENLSAFFRWPLPVQGNRVAVLPVVACGVATAGLFIGLYWLFPQLELLGPADRTRYQRFRGAAVGVLLGVVSIIVAAPIVNLLFGHNP